MRQFLKTFNTKWILGLYLRLYIKEITGTENIPKPPFIIASNHNSMIDGIGLLYIMTKHSSQMPYALTRFNPINDTWISRIIYRFWYLVAISLFNVVSVWKKGSVDAMVKKLNEGKCVIIFPEGAPNTQKQLLKARTGMARIALTAKVPLIPIGSMDCEKILPEKKYFPRFKRASFKIGKPMTFPGYDLKDINKVTGEVMKEIATLCSKEYC